VFLAASVDAATLRVPTEYTTINQALDATSPGDTVLVAPGHYTDSEERFIVLVGTGFVTSCAFLKSGVSLIAKAGRTQRRSIWQEQGSVRMPCSSSSRLAWRSQSFFRVLGDNSGALRWFSAPGTCRNNTLYGNSVASPGDRGAALSIISGLGAVDFSNNVIAHSGPGSAVWLQAVGQTNACNVFWDNPDGNVVGMPLDESTIYADPQFCDPESNDFTLMSGSPCLPENSNGCGLVGAFGGGCGTVSVTPETWATIKSKYR
jgi:hypothetical protein